MDLPVTIKPYIKRSGTGQKIYGPNINTLCYAEGKVVVVSDSSGAEVVSNMQLYLDGPVEINELDAIIFDKHEKSIKSIGTFYRKGVADLKVVYL